MTNEERRLWSFGNAIISAITYWCGSSIQKKKYRQTGGPYKGILSLLFGEGVKSPALTYSTVQRLLNILLREHKTITLEHLKVEANWIQLTLIVAPEKEKVILDTITEEELNEIRKRSKDG